MKKSHPALLTAFLLSASFPIHAHDETTLNSNLICIENTVPSFVPFTGAVKGNKVRMRVQPNLEGHVVRETASNEMFIVVGEINDFYAIVPPKETKGYVFRTFILDDIVEGERVNVRLYPDIDAPVIGQLNKGDKVEATLSDINNKWLEIPLSNNSCFYIAKEYLENKGSPELLVALENKRNEAAHVFSAASLYAQSEIQKPFEQIDLDRINEKFEQIAKNYPDVPIIVEQVNDVMSIMQDIYLQKKIAFLESKANHQPIAANINTEHLAKLSKLGINIKAVSEDQASAIASAATTTIGLSSPANDSEITDKMLVWQPLEESLYHLWAATNGEKSMQEFYAQEQQEASFLTGIIEPYTRPVKNRPGDFLLRNDAMPIAYLYSTHINLEKLVGQKVILLGAPRPNHDFAFPAYFVISVE